MELAAPVVTVGAPAGHAAVVKATSLPLIVAPPLLASTRTWYVVLQASPVKAANTGAATAVEASGLSVATNGLPAPP